MKLVSIATALILGATTSFASAAKVPPTPEPRPAVKSGNPGTITNYSKATGEAVAVKEPPAVKSGNPGTSSNTRK